MTHSTSFSQESSVQNITQFWQSGQFSSFQGKNNVRINYAAFVNQSDAPCLVISPGRVEGYLKYQEFAFELSGQGINIFIIDHRSQGLSQRLLSNPHKGHVEQFDDYADDLHQFITEILPKYCNNTNKPLVLAHSMGGAITIRMMQKYPQTIKAALLSSPMIAINSGGVPLWLAKTLVSIGNFINTLLGRESGYFFGQGDYQAKPFSENQLMHDPMRYQRFIELYQQQSTLQLGGVTFNWLQQAISANQMIFAELEKLQSPITILQASADSVVDNQAQNDFCQQLQRLNTELCQPPIVIEGAYHELFFEQDKYRDQVINEISRWLAKYQN